VLSEAKRMQDNGGTTPTAWVRTRPDQGTILAQDNGGTTPTGWVRARADEDAIPAQRWFWQDAG